MGSTYASIYLRQQPQSFLSRDTLQFHTARPLSVQDVIDELVHDRATGYFFCFFLLLRKFPCLEDLDDVLCPCRRLGLDGKDQRHLFCRGSGRLHGHDLRSCRSWFPRGRIGIHGNIFAGGSGEFGGEVLAGA